ncbi:hypothetical protein [Apibacter adventoris]|uniref:Uncharacterized protein n=1 Tax=Apibacter adventoris TaxID=1679466 RepID=A0A2S8AGE1_9FLAO|nr:hypothetical protein [Apibacter adventoris]PQL95444.1 hypothetical protein C4S77_01215 [Apibacter adventoris]
MKKVISLLFMFLSIGLIFTSCNDDDDYYYPIDNNNNNNNNNNSPLLYEVNNVSFNYDSYANMYLFLYNFKLYKGENLLIYIQSGWVNNEPVWTLLPNYALYTASDNKTYNMFFNYNFTMQNFEITAESSVAMPPELNGLNFRIIVFQSTIKTKHLSDTVDYNDYKAVINHYKIDESKVKVIKP